MVKDKLSKNTYHFPAFLLVLLYLSVLAAVTYGEQLVGGADYYFHNARFEALMVGLKDGTFPSYIDYTGMYGYGYLVKPFYSDFVLIPFAALANLTGKIFAYQFLLFSMTFLCELFMYIFIRKVYKSTYAASIGAILYAFSLYRLYDLYHRAAWGEAFSFTFLPIVFLGLYHIIKGDYKKWYIIAIGFSLMILTHVLSTLLLFATVCIFLLIYWRSLYNEPKRILYLCLAGLSTIVISGYYLFPFIEQLQSNTFYFARFKHSAYATYQATKSLTEIVQALFAGWDMKQAVPAIGFMATIPVLLRCFLWGKENKTQKLKSVDTGVLIGILYIIMNSSLIPWDKFPLYYLSIIQFPWRLYEFVTFFFALAGGYYIYLICKTEKLRVIVSAAVIILLSAIIVIDASIYKENRLTPRLNDTEFNEVTHYLQAGMEYYPSKLPFPDPFIKDRKDSIISQTKETTISGFVRNEYITEFNIQTNGKDSIELPLIYYKGYAALLDGEETAVSESRNGLVQIPVDKSGRVEVWYKGTLIQKISFILTILSIFVLCIYIYKQKRTAKNNV